MLANRKIFWVVELQSIGNLCGRINGKKFYMKKIVSLLQAIKFWKVKLYQYSDIKNLPIISVEELGVAKVNIFLDFSENKN